MRRIRAKLTYSNVVSTLCLVLLLGGGTAYAASQFAKESIGTNALKKEAVTPAKLSKKAKAALQGPAGEKGAPGVTGPQGPKGDQGAPGSAKAWAEVKNSGAVVRSSPGVTAFKQSTGVYCVKTGVFDNSNSVATGIINDSDSLSVITFSFAISNTEAFNDCPDGEGYFAVYVRNEKNEAKDAGFVIVLN
jgi:hypothetical protein